eukprot:scaffold2756_cov105-Cylindrotheca_fusiformis.AAC.1
MKKKSRHLVALVAAAIFVSMGVSFFGLFKAVGNEPLSQQSVNFQDSQRQIHESQLKVQKQQEELLHQQQQLLELQHQQRTTKSSLVNAVDNRIPAVVDQPGECHPRFPILTQNQIYNLVKLWFDAYCPIDRPKAADCKFISIGRYLLDHAIKHDRTLLTVQIGAMDGKSNDPIYDMFVRTVNWQLRKSDKFQNLQNWLPVLLEPVPENFKNLIATYQEIEEKHGLPCSIPINAAISYSSTESECAFCRYNTDADAPEECSHADWMKFQLGSLDCGYHQRFFGQKIFDKCIIKDPLPCGPVSELLKKRAPYLPQDATVAMVQIDVESYEYILLSGLLTDLKPLPPVIHFENKVMKAADRKTPLENGEKRLEIAISALEDAGYVVYEEGEDSFGFYLPTK